MNNINFKKYIPSIIALVLIVGMAASTFATNIDLAAFIERDEYLTKFYELDYRIDDIDSELEKLYKYTCTNVRTLGSSYWGNNSHNYNYMYAPGTGVSALTQFWSHGYQVEVSQEKYLRFNQPAVLNLYSSIYDPTKLLRTFEGSIPASRCIWKEGIEPAPNAKVIWRGRLNSIPSNNYSIEFVFGPFNKFPRITSPGTQVTQGMFCELPFAPYGGTIGDTQFYYKTDSKTEPTSWTIETSSTRMSVGNGYRGEPNYSWMTPPTDEERDGGFYKEVVQNRTNRFRITSAAYNVLDGKKDIWLRFYLTGSGQDLGSYAAILDRSFTNLTSWNTKTE